MPFIAAPMACSRMPQFTVVPVVVGPKVPPVFRAVPVLSARSAEPPMSSGSTALSACTAVCDACRVASGPFSAGTTPSASFQPAGSSPRSARA
jgi:hypothetical protein